MLTFFPGPKDIFGSSSNMMSSTRLMKLGEYQMRTSSWKGTVEAKHTSPLRRS